MTVSDCNGCDCVYLHVAFDIVHARKVVWMHLIRNDKVAYCDTRSGRQPRVNWPSRKNRSMCAQSFFSIHL